MQATDPAKRLVISKVQNLAIDASIDHKIRRSMDFETLDFVKCSVGISVSGRDVNIYVQI